MDLPVKYKNLNSSRRRAVREEYIRVQEGKCYHCGQLLNENPPPHITNKPIKWSLFPPGFQNNPIHLHHSHDTGLTLGAVHSYCNAVLWQYYGE